MNLYYLYALFMKAILVYLHNDKDACLSPSNSTVLAAIFFGTIQPITLLYSYRILVRFQPIVLRNRYRILVRFQPIIFQDWYRKSAIARLLKIDSFLSCLLKRLAESSPISYKLFPFLHLFSTFRHPFAKKVSLLISDDLPV